VREILAKYNGGKVSKGEHASWLDEIDQVETFNHVPAALNFTATGEDDFSDLEIIRRKYLG
jgi:hypothetical protein